ncbi:MAG: hypothetical protein KDD59_04890, partial [Bdellovibrionales bacterium]|nr:hypothetical protein [Bdellovibrionales bacterium]
LLFLFLFPTQATPWIMKEMTWLSTYEDEILGRAPWLSQKPDFAKNHGKSLDENTEEFRQETIKHIFRVITLSVHLAHTVSDNPLLPYIVFAKAVQHDREKVDFSREYKKRHGYLPEESILERLARFNNLSLDELPDTNNVAQISRKNLKLLIATFNQMGARDLSKLDGYFKERLGDRYTDELMHISTELVNVADKVDTYLVRQEEFNRPMLAASQWFSDPAKARLAQFLEDEGQHFWVLSEGLQLHRYFAQLQVNDEGFHLPPVKQIHSPCRETLLVADAVE